MENTSFSVPSMSCSVCSTKIQNELRNMQGVQNISVDMKSQQVNVEFDPAITNAQDIRKKVSSLGYEVEQ